MMKKFDCFFGGDPFNGSLRIAVPELFTAERKYSPEGSLQTRVSTNEDELDYGRYSLIQNNVIFRGLLKRGLILQWYLPKRVTRNLLRARTGGDMGRFRDIAWGYSEGVFRNIEETVDADLKVCRDRYFGRELIENESVWGFIEDQGSTRTYIVPGVFTIVSRGEELELNHDPVYLRENAQRFRRVSREKGKILFPITKKNIDLFTDACFRNKQRRIHKITRRILNEADEYLGPYGEDVGGDEGDGKTMIEG